MGKLFLYEWKKLFRQPSFLFFTLALLLGNLLTLFQYEKHTDSYLYFYQFRQDWQQYANGDQVVDNAEYYRALEEAAQNYVSSYGVFLEQIPEQAEKLKKTGNYQDHNTYLYRNLMKTVSDYKGLSADGIKPELGIGITELASYNYGICFQLIFLFALSYFAISAERKKGLFLLTKGTENGHLPLAASKLLAMVSASVMYSFLQECSGFFLLGYFYGYGDAVGKIQSLSMFRDCSVPLTVAQAVMILLGVRMLLGVLCALLIFCLTIRFRKEGTALLIYASVLALEFFLYVRIQISSSLNIAKCVNLFFSWDMKNIFGIYRNLDLFGYPVGKSFVALAVGGMLACIFAVAGLHRFSSSCQISSGNLLEAVREKMAKRLSFQWHSVSVYLFEFRKVFCQQRRGYLFLILFVWCVLCARETMEPSFYDDPAEGEYHRILSQISGAVTDESLKYIADQRREIDDMYVRLDNLNNKSEEQAEFERDMLFHEIKIRDEGIALVEEQRDRLLEKNGSIYDKFWVDEKNYMAVFYDYQYDLTAFLAGAIALVLWMSEIEAADERKEMYPMLYATRAGKKQIRQKKNRVCITGMFWCAVCALIPQFVRYFRIDHFQNAGQMMRDFTQIGVDSPVCVGVLILFFFLAKMVLFFLVCGLLLLLVRKICNTAVVIGAGVGCVGLPVLLLWYFHMDLVIFWLGLQGGW